MPALQLFSCESHSAGIGLTGLSHHLLDTDERRYRGRIDALILQERFWVLAIEYKGNRFLAESSDPTAFGLFAGESKWRSPGLWHGHEWGKFCVYESAGGRDATV